MKNRHVFFLFILSLFVQIQNASAINQKITDIYTFPEDGRIFHFFLELDSKTNNIQGVFLEYTKDNGIDDTKSYSFKKICEEGEVIYRQDSYDVIILRCPGCDEVTGGTLIAEYLYNGFYSTYEQFNMDLAKGMDELWRLYSPQKEEIKSLHLKPNYFWGELVGIKEITINE